LLAILLLVGKFSGFDAAIALPGDVNGKVRVLEPVGDGVAPQVVVRYADLNLDSDAGALALYRRIAVAARRVCPNDHPLELRHAQTVRTCRDQALTRAIAAVGSPRLAAIQADRMAWTRVG
jgi:UrcA family protein